MPLRSPPTPPRYDPSVQRGPDPRHLFDRDPLLVPQRFVEIRPPWYKRPWLVLAIVVIVCTMSTMGYLMSRHGVRGAMVRVGGAGVAILHVYTRIVAGQPTAAF